MKLQCVSCDRLFTERDISAGVYCVETLTCGYCYAELQQLPHSQSCFGKPTVKLPDGKQLLGYDPKAEECSYWCGDRVACAKIMKGSADED